ncbi:threonine synthase [Sphingosinicella sp. CPCC 101087]|uniref:threonine synthase n=1 Tax=Sphingosinicella sp. CPCC 101087 TaxID=2497754 RepID=UPI00101BC15D|nr:threonine synthase [Sphingosinicella sp. CPCC 101087]
MKFVSTRGASPAVSISEAIRNGAAPDGGLYVPAHGAAADFAALDGDDLPSLAASLLAPFFAGDRLAADLPAICAEAFDFPVPLVVPDPADKRLRALELFHGPTGAFKDFGARFLMACFDRLGLEEAPLTVLAATSGDTGGAVGCAAEGRRSVRAVILFPRGRVSPFQRLQLGCWREPVTALEVEGDFDDCQRLVKAAFADPAVARRHRLSSANSINVGRLLPQMVYLAGAALEVRRETGVDPGLIVPTGNLGHGVAALWARALGAPIGPVLAVTNANRTLSEWHRSGAYEPRASVATIANAMDVGAPSNFERLARLPDPRRQLDVELVDDAAIKARIEAEHRRTGYVWCPHSATAAEGYARLDPGRREERVWIAAATAHPFKFAEDVEPLIGEKLAPPPALAAILDRPSTSRPIPATLEALVEALAEAPAAAEVPAA